ncbi:respiratory supercomplex factor 1, mitochondrial [Chelonus insularis]|uniref:respiratory supercomplex factor 1, mitochondrial n=1 Tax=Chelonus insularis TaxID=460826 RepID=UPI00158B7C26|nr:respiratory supercomplex factor 1, mitochondrial [Chelonus insularis]
MSKAPLPTPTPELEWVKIREELAEYDQIEPFQKKFKRVLIEHPLVPLGIMATCGSLVLGMRAMVQGDRLRSNLMMRFRIFFQAVTVAAMTVSAVTVLKSREKSEKLNENST